MQVWYCWGQRVFIACVDVSCVRAMLCMYYITTSVHLSYFPFCNKVDCIVPVQFLSFLKKNNEYRICIVLLNGISIVKCDANRNIRDIPTPPFRQTYTHQKCVIVENHYSYLFLKQNNNQSKQVLEFSKMFICTGKAWHIHLFDHICIIYLFTNITRCSFWQFETPPFRFFSY